MNCPLPSNEASRLGALHRYEILDSAAEAAFDDLAALASDICGTPMALVSLVDAHRQWFKSRVGVAGTETSRDVAFCAHTIMDDEILEVPNTLEDARFRHSPLVTSEPGVRFYAGAPLTTPDGYHLGAICVMDRRPRHLDRQQREALERLAKQAVALLELRLGNRRLAQQAAFQHNVLARSVAVIITTPEGQVTHFNPEAEQLFGYPAQEVLGKVTPVVFHDGAEIAQRAAAWSAELGRPVAPGFEVLVARARAGHMDSREWSCLRKDGTRLVVRLAVSPLRDEADVSGFLFVASDLTEQRRAESERDNFFNFSLDILCTATGDGYLKRVNPACTHILGWSEAELLSRPFLDFVHPEDRAATKQQAENLAAGQIVTEFENRYLCKDGTWRILSWRCVPHMDGTLYASARDVTEERRAEKMEQQFHKQTNLFQRTLLDLRDHDGDDVRTMLQTMTSSVAEAMEVGRVSIWLFEETQTAIVCADLYQRTTRAHDSGLRLTADDYPAYFKAATQRDPIVAHDAHTHPATREFSAGYLTPLGITSMLDVPILKDGRLRGVVCHEHTGPAREWTPEEVKFATSVANCVTLKLEQTERQAAERALRELNATLERRVAERTAELQDSEARFRQLAEGIESVFWCTNRDMSELHYVSPAYEKVWGRPLEDLRANALAWVESIHPDDRPRTLAAMAAANQGSGSSFELEYRIVRPDGGIRHVRDRGFPIRDAQGQTVRIVGVADDVTEKVMAEREFRQAMATLDATEDGAFIFEPQSLRFIYVNQGACKQLGYSREELLAMTPLDIAPEFNEPRMRRMIAPMLQGKSHSHHYTTTHRTKDGRDVPVEINLQYITLDGEQPRFIAAVRDVSERRKMEQQASRSQRLEAIGTLAGGVAHDLNNALAPIMMGIDGLKRKCPAERAVLDIFESSANRAASMVRQLLTFAKGTEGKRIAIQPLHLIKELREILKGTFPKNIRLHFDWDADLPIVIADATQLHQILINLCVNARDAMPNGGALHLAARRLEVDAMYAGSVADATPGTYLLLQVSDTGTGIPPEILDRIFDPFFTTKAPDKGTGLGLSTVLGIVKGHGGFLQVHSHVGQGTTIAVHIPAETSGHVYETERAPQVFRGSGELILLVDDEESIREIGSQVISSLNFQVVTATDGVDALLKVAEHRKDLRAIITDQHMPHMDGLSMVRAVRRILPEIPIAVGSGRLDDAVAAGFRTCGVITRLDKPYTQSLLADALEAMLSPRETHRG